MECQVCCESITVATAIVDCPACHYLTCVDCAKRYVLEKMDDPRCMKQECRLPMNRLFMTRVFGREFMRGEYRIHRENVLLEKEKAHLPAAVEDAKRLREERVLKTENAKTRKHLRRIVKRHGSNSVEAKAVRAQLHTISPQTQTRTEKNTQIVCPCPRSGCRSFITDNDYQCGVCSTRVCSECLCSIDHNQDHECAEADIQTAAEIRRMTKPCPKCAVPVMKSGGCDQMWCTHCKTTFSWDTLKIDITGANHNPHFYDWLANGGANTMGLGGRDMEDLACGEVPPSQFVWHHLYQWWPGFLDTRRVLDVYRKIHHVTEVELPRFSVDRIRDGHHMRVLYLLGEKTEAQWKKYLLWREKRMEKNSDMTDFINMYLTVARDMVRRLCADLAAVDVAEECPAIKFLDEVAKFEEYIQEQKRVYKEIYTGAFPF